MPAVEPSTCVFSADFHEPDGRPSFRLPITCWLRTGPVWWDGNWVDGRTVYKTDATGHVEFPLIKNLEYTVRIGNRSDITFQITCPDADTADLFDYLLPRLVTITFVDAPYSVNVGDVLPITLLGTFSDGTTEDVSSACTLSTADASVATVSNQTLAGILAGSTTVSIAAVAQDQLPVRKDMLQEVLLFYPEITYTTDTPKTVTVVG